MGVDITKDDVGVIISAVISAAGVIAGLTFDKTLGAIVTAVGVIVTAIFGYLKARRAEASAQQSAREVARISAAAAIDTNSKTVLVQTVTVERAKWRSEMREIVSELSSLLHASARGETVDWRAVDKLRAGVRLRLNPEGRGAAPVGVDKNEKDRRLHMDLDDLALAGPGGAASHDAIADRLEKNMADLVKDEWEGSKGEAVTGKLKS